MLSEKFVCGEKYVNFIQEKDRRNECKIQMSVMFYYILCNSNPILTSEFATQPHYHFSNLCSIGKQITKLVSRYGSALEMIAPLVVVLDYQDQI